MHESRRVQRLQRKLRPAATADAPAAARAVGYLRVSTEEQAAGGYGLDAQERAVRAFAASQGCTLVDVIVDAGVSGAGAPETRPGFARVLELAAAGDCAVLLVWKFDRLARHLVHAVRTAHRLQEEYGVVLRSVTEPIDTATAIGQMIFAVLAGMAQQEREAITARTLGGKKEKSRRGGFAGGAAPLGYARDREGGLCLEPAEADIVARIFALRQAGHTLQEIARQLNDAGAPTKRGGRWHPATVRYILDNPKYRGQIEYYFRWKGAAEVISQPGVHPPIVIDPEGEGVRISER